MKRKPLFIMIGLIIAVLTFLFISYVRHLDSEVTNAFEIMNEEFQKANEVHELKIDSIQTSFESTIYKYKIAELDSLTSDLDRHIESLKQELVSKIEDGTDYSKMGSSSESDAYFFSKPGYSFEGKLFVQKIENYKIGVVNLFMKEAPIIVERLNSQFNNHEGVDNWLVYNFKGFPLVAVLTNLTQIQGDIKQNKQDILLELTNIK